ncbi:UNKNOWN [Stylonychia lemnae]|uniref:Transmembrane protein n=1 Tax=Stylonychia lemnae TaxID=5949 RepID=A0A078AP84_STYLE|nr:UNKNOWN [Stylonychia lemnae]|eukprot:CDW83746.1 UNKNOWN [Stylonychia lemnae]
MSWVSTFFIILLSRVIDKEYQIRIKSTYKSALNDMQSYQINLQNFDIAFGVRYQRIDNSQSIQNDYKASNIQGTDSLFSNQTVIQSKACSSERFLGMENDINQIGLTENNWVCISDFKLSVEGQDMSLIKKSLNLKVELCQNTSLPQTGIENSPAKIVFQFMVAYVNKDHDADDFNHSVKKEINIQFYNPVFGFNQIAILNLQSNDLNVKDSPLMDIFSMKQYNFFKVVSQGTQYATWLHGYQELFNLYLVCDDKEINIEQTVYTVVNIFTTIGGYNNFLILFYRVLSSTYKRQAFYWDLMCNLFYFHKNNKKSQHEEVEKTNKFNKKILKNEIKNRVQEIKYSGIYKSNYEYRRRGLILICYNKEGGNINEYQSNRQKEQRLKNSQKKQTEKIFQSLF